MPPAGAPSYSTFDFGTDTDMILDSPDDREIECYFASSLPIEASSPAVHFAENYEHEKKLAISSPQISLNHGITAGPYKFDSEALSAHSSTSPGGSLRDSSPDSSTYNRKSSSDSSMTTDIKHTNMVDADMRRWGQDQMMLGEEQAFEQGDGTINPAAMSNGFGFNDKSMENDFDFDSAASSPQTFEPGHIKLQSPEMPTIKYGSPRKSPKFKPKFGHHAKQSQNSITQSMHGLTTSASREGSPLSAMVTSQESSPSGFFNNSPSPNIGVEYVNGQMLGAGPGQQWPVGYDYSMANMAQTTGLTPPSLMSNMPSPLSSGVSFASAYRPSLTVHPTPMKSRVETQIPIKLTLFPLPPGIVHLHLPRHTISKPKLLAKPPSERQPDTLELYTMLVCTSAMQNPDFQRRAFARAAALPTSTAGSSPESAEGTPDEDDESRPLNGGEVKICPGCITRERKRAARKKVKKVEEEESWHKDEHKRAIVFNTHELKDWAQPTGQIPSEATGDRLEPYVPEGALQVDAPMRIACYCRHQNEKLGFQVIFTIKDYQDRVIAQAISSSIMITDDHKTHNMPSLPTTTGTGEAPIFSGTGTTMSENGFEIPTAPFRSSQSSSDLQSLQRSFPPAFNAPLSASSSAGPSQNTSATMTPRNMSRQASPTSLGGPSTKKRKSSGSGKVPTGLAMTRMENAPSGSATAGSIPSAISATSPFMPNIPAFPMVDTQFGAPGLNTGVQQFNTGPPTPNSNDQLFFSNANRSQSMENLAMHQLYSAPTSAHPSRAPSPNGLRNSMQSYQQHQAQIAQAVANGLYGMPLALNPHRPPTIHKMIPNEGPKAGGIEVTCLGSGFCQGLEVMFGETRATTTTFWGETSLVCLLPPSAFAGTVAVTFAHQHAQQQAAFPQQPLPKQQATFKYIDDDEQQIIRLALSVLGHKMNGKMEDVRDLARRIVGDGSSSWGAAPGPSPTGGSNHQMSGFNAATFGVDVEATLLRCLDLVDLDDSPHMPRLNLRQASGQTMLHLACSLGLHRFVAALLARGANPEPRDKGGYTPMHFAAMYDHPHIVRRLILSGADPTMRNLKGYTPADLARSEAVLQSTRRFQHHTRTRSAGSIRSRTSSATSLRSLWEPPSTMLPARLPENGEDEDTSDDNVSSEDEDGDEDLPTVWMKQKSRRSSAQFNESLVQRQVPLIEPPTIGVTNGRPTSPTAAVAAFRDQLGAQFAHLQQSMHLNLPQMPTLPMIPALPDYQAYLQSAPMVRRISAMVPAMGGRQAPAEESTGAGMKEEADYRWWDLFSGTMPQAPPAYDDIFPGSQTDLDTKKTSAATAAADIVADDKCALLFDQTTTNAAEAESSATRSALLENLKVGKKHTISRAQQEQLRLAHAEKVKRFRSDRNLFFIWIPLLVIIVLAMLYNRVPQAWAKVNDFIGAMNNQGRIVEV